MGRREKILRAVAATASNWCDPEHQPRADAVLKTLEVDNTFTLEAITFAVNQQMSVLNSKRLDAWTRDAWSDDAQLIGVLNAGNISFCGAHRFGRGPVGRS